MDRRDFLRQVAAWSVAAGAIPLIRVPQTLAQTAPATAPARRSLLAVGKGADYAAVVKNVITRLGGMSAFVKSGDKVVIKPNIGWDRTPEQGANTHPIVVATLVQLALDAGAKQVMVFDRTCDDPRRCYVKSGIKATVEAIKDPRVSCPYCDEAKFIPVRIDNGKAIQEWSLYKDALEADCYINVPVAKHHGLGTLTLCLKNVMGVCGGNRARIHQQMSDKLVDLTLAIRPKLHVLDATRILTAHGPQGGNLADVKQLDTICASTDPIACDAYATRLFDRTPESIPATVAGNNRGLGEMDLSKVDIAEV